MEAVLLSPSRNPYAEIEDIVAATEQGAQDGVTQRRDLIDDAAASAADVEPTTNWTTTFWIWLTDAAAEFGSTTFDF